MSNKKLDRSQRDEVAADYLYRLAVESVRMEDERGHALDGYAGHLLSAISIVAVAVLSVAEPLFSVFDSPWQRTGLLVAYVAVMLCYVASFILSLLAVNRRKYRALEAPVTISSAFDGEFQTWTQAARTYSVSVQEYFDTRTKYNDRVCRLLVAARTVLLAGTGLLAVAVVFFAVVAVIDS